MYHILIIWVTIGWCGAMVTPIRDEETGSKQIDHQEHSNEKMFVTSEVDDRQQASYFSLNRENQATSSQYLYSIYPDYSNNRYMIQTGYKDYPIPSTLSSQTIDSYLVTEIATSLLPSFDEILIYGVRVGAYLLYFFFMVFLKGAFMTMICTYTPICTMSFLGFGLTNNQVKEQVERLDETYVTTEAVNAAILLISKAVENYRMIEDEKCESTNRKELEKPMK